MAIPVQSVVDRLVEQGRVIVIGGLAVIALGRERHTKDVDLWLDPIDTPTAWAERLRNALTGFEGISIHRLPGWIRIGSEGVADAIEETGMIRLLGLDKPLDLFRSPNEFEIGEFEGVASRASRNGDGTLLPDPLDLFQTKIDTGREKDSEDMLHLERLTREKYVRLLPSATLQEASDLLDRYSEWQVLQAALRNPSPEVRELAMTHLKEFAAAGDPFSLAILEGREIP
jgi:hypothetical protein